MPGRHVHRGHPGRGRHLVDGRLGLPGDGVDVLRPVQAVEQPPLTGDRDLVAEHPVRCRGEAGAERRQAGDSGGREPRGSAAGS